ncbi:hypothetical protein Ciccas_005344 [Cichlidogyrus casuarinus]|uniref:Uncharacterized protein n=1 Tax=Cichlidogyrus casuarinus TaxID=1844966 RepID=A0ABD2QCI5_9PLAT
MAGSDVKRLTKVTKVNGKATGPSRNLLNNINEVSSLYGRKIQEHLYISKFSKIQGKALVAS